MLSTHWIARCFGGAYRPREPLQNFKHSAIIRGSIRAYVEHVDCSKSAEENSQFVATKCTDDSVVVNPDRSDTQAAHHHHDHGQQHQ